MFKTIEPTDVSIKPFKVFRNSGSSSKNESCPLSVAISEYDQTLEEDGVTNRHKESLELFDAIVNNSKWFNMTPTIIIFTKVDRLETKLLTTTAW